MFQLEATDEYRVVTKKAFCFEQPLVSNLFLNKMWFQQAKCYPILAEVVLNKLWFLFIKHNWKTSFVKHLHAPQQHGVSTKEGEYFIIEEGKKCSINLNVTKYLPQVVCGTCGICNINMNILTLDVYFVDSGTDCYGLSFVFC